MLVETLETATFWSNLPRLYADVQAALTSRPRRDSPLVLCHISHVYETGASLYFTVAAASATTSLAQWRAAKRAASDAIIAAGATITHHHAVGPTTCRGWPRSARSASRCCARSRSARPAGGAQPRRPRAAAPVGVLCVSRAR